MNIYVIEMVYVDYDEFSGFVVIAKNKKTALLLCDIIDKKGRDNLYKDNVEYIILVGKSIFKTEQIILSSFNAG